MNRKSRLILLATFVAAPLCQAQALGIYSFMYFVGPKMDAGSSETGSVDRVERASFDRSSRFVISRFDRKMIEEFSRAWIRAADGTAANESVVLILRMVGGGYSARSLGTTNQNRAFTFGWHPATVAIVHTHPNGSDPRPQGEDINVADKYRVPVFTITSRGMFVYDPSTKTTSLVKRNLDWLDPSKWTSELAQKQ
jgi:hypothetical protein